MTDISSETARTGMAGRFGTRGAARRLSTETKSAFKTTEFWLYIAGVAGILITSDAVGTADRHGDYFRADRAWL
jgi:hypothetical protein